jgi:hypothetical protein
MKLAKQRYDKPPQAYVENVKLTYTPNLDDYDGMCVEKEPTDKLDTIIGLLERIERILKEK